MLGGGPLARCGASGSGPSRTRANRPSLAPQRHAAVWRGDRRRRPRANRVPTPSRRTRSLSIKPTGFAGNLRAPEPRSPERLPGLAWRRQVTRHSPAARGGRLKARRRRLEGGGRSMYAVALGRARRDSPVRRPQRCPQRSERSEQHCGRREERHNKIRDRRICDSTKHRRDLPMRRPQRCPQRRERSEQRCGRREERRNKTRDGRICPIRPSGPPEETAYAHDRGSVRR